MIFFAAFAVAFASFAVKILKRKVGKGNRIKVAKRIAGVSVFA